MSYFSRRTGSRRYKKKFVIVAEGTVTEHEYFNMFNGGAIVSIQCLQNRTSLPPDKALEKATTYLKNEGLRKGDEIWVVVDLDSWDHLHLHEIHKWSQSAKNRGFALSNPRFETWLLLHFEDAKGRDLSSDCNTKLRRHHPGYDKHLNPRLFTQERIDQAILRAKRRDTPQCIDWPRRHGSTVYRLVEKILSSQINSA